MLDRERMLLDLSIAPVRCHVMTGLRGRSLNAVLPNIPDDAGTGQIQRSGSAASVESASGQALSGQTGRRHRCHPQQRRDANSDCANNGKGEMPALRRHMCFTIPCVA